MAKKKTKPKNKKDALWVEAKRKCRLNNEDIHMAKEMGLNPRSLIKNIPSKSQPWKSPVKDWIREMYKKRKKKAARKKSCKQQAISVNSETILEKLPEDSSSMLKLPITSLLSQSKETALSGVNYKFSLTTIISTVLW